MGITKCAGTNCPAKDSCERYKAKANPYWQSYLCDVPWDEYHNCCEMWLERTTEENNDG